MKFSLDVLIALAGEEALFLSATELAQDAALAPKAGDLLQAEARLLATIDGQDAFGEFVPDPLVRMVDGWLKKLPWIIGGDTETVALRNSEQCFAFVPAAEHVEVSFFVGSEAEIEDYILEPTLVRLEVFVEESLALGRRVLSLVERQDPGLLKQNEEVSDFVVSLREAESAWHDHQLHARR